MRYFGGDKYFNEKMIKVKEILEDKGYVMESDHPYVYAMQYDEAFLDVEEWMEENGYDGHLGNLGLYKGVAVYGLYYKDRVSYNEMMKHLGDEATKQNLM